MRCSSAVVLSTLAVGQAAAANVHNRHASFHARREAAKRGDNNVNWDAVAYDLKDVKWDQVNWSSVFGSSATKPTPTLEKPVVAAAVTPTPEPKKEIPAPSSTKPVDTPKPAAPSSKPDSTGDKINDVVTNVFQGVQALADELGIKVGKNDKSNSSPMYISPDGKWGMDVTNTGSKYAVWTCWQKADMYLTQNPPLISVGLQPGEKTTLSFSENASGACAAVQETTSFKTFGGAQDTWAEFTIAGKDSTFNVSKNVNMQGRAISMKGSQCTADMQTCVFQCKDTSATSCQYGYDLVNCNKNNGGGGGWDPIMGGVGGGCTMNANGDRLKVSFS